MIISKAIELLDLYYCHLNPEPQIDCINAIKLGIEALKRIQTIRLHPGAPIYGPLPGETPRQ